MTTPCLLALVVQAKSSGIETGREAGPNVADRCVAILPAYGWPVALRDNSHNARRGAQSSPPRTQLIRAVPFIASGDALKTSAHDSRFLSEVGPRCNEQSLARDQRSCRSVWGESGDQLALRHWFHEKRRDQGTKIMRTVSVIAAPPEAEPAITTTVSPDLARPESLIWVTAKSQRSPISVAGER